MSSQKKNRPAGGPEQLSLWKRLVLWGENNPIIVALMMLGVIFVFMDDVIKGGKAAWELVSIPSQPQATVEPPQPQIVPPVNTDKTPVATAPKPDCRYIVFERFAAEDPNSKLRKQFRLNLNNPSGSHEVTLADWQLPRPSILTIKDLPRELFYVTLRFVFNNTPDASIPSKLDLSGSSTMFHADLSFDHGLSFRSLSENDYFDYIGRHQLKPTTCANAPNGLSWDGPR